jgi:hypothetical protein
MMSAFGKPVAVFLGSAALAVVLGSGARAATTTTPVTKPVAKPAAPAVKWLELDAGLAAAKSGSKPAVLVFCGKDYKGAATFDTDALVKALTGSGAVAVKVCPPVAPKAPTKATADDIKKLNDNFADAQKKYQDALTKYGVTVNPTVVFLTPDGDEMGLLANPTADQLTQALANLPKTLEAFKAAKAAAQPAPAAPAPAPADKPKAG